VDDSLRFFKDLRGSRYHDFPLLARSDEFALGVAKSMDCLLCMLVFAVCRRLRRHYREMVGVGDQHGGPSLEVNRVPEARYGRKPVELETVGGDESIGRSIKVSADSCVGSGLGALRDTVPPTRGASRQVWLGGGRV
jgi:hypothetical protein